MTKEFSVMQHIESNWDNCIVENRADDDSLIGLPYPYVVPSVGHFDEMYYWDTYFTNKGLEISGRMAQVKYNTDNMLYLVNKYGFMPNGNRVYYLDRSQPPFLSLMVRDVFEYYKDKAWLSGAYTALEREYSFWMTNRITPGGLNHYDCCIDEKNIEQYAKMFADRVGYMPDGNLENIARHMMVCAESGWDISPRWGTDGYNFAPVDLNSLMYAFETNMEYFSNELNNGYEKLWSDRAKKRRSEMRNCMSGSDGLFFDYNFVSAKNSEILSAASLYPLFVGMANDNEAKAIVNNLYRLEAQYGILTCEKNDTKGRFQWDYPNGWACLQYVAIIGLDRYGYKEEAKRIAQKYTGLVENVYETSGNLWEKYNVVEGNINVVNEYGLPAMMGWSAGVYLAAKEYLKSV